jgi:hypothetical protein
VKAEDYSRRQEELVGWAVTIETYRVDAVYYCTISNVDPGARFARAEGASREEAERAALAKAERYLGHTRRFQV